MAAIKLLRQCPNLSKKDMKGHSASKQFVMGNLYKSVYITKRSPWRKKEFAGKLMQWIHRRKKKRHNSGRPKGSLYNE